MRTALDAPNHGQTRPLSHRPDLNHPSDPDTAYPAVHPHISRARQGTGLGAPGAAGHRLQQPGRAGKHARAVDVGGRVHVRRVRAQQRRHDRGRGRRAAGQRRGLLVAAVGGDWREEAAE